jgi:DNA-binding MarR family transcriptional regulator
MSHDHDHDHDEPPWYVDFSAPVLLDIARRTYGAAIRVALAEIGCDDMPKQGARLVGGIARNGTGLGEFSRVLGTTKQAASQLVDTLVMRGYIERTPDEVDRRRMIVTLTPRGADAAEAIRAAVDGIDAALTGEVGAEAVLTMRRVCAALTELRPEPTRRGE